MSTPRTRDALAGMLRRRGLDPDKVLKTAAQVELEQKLADPSALVIEGQFRRLPDKEEK